MPIPDRWDDYQPMGSVIPGTKFLAFKVPLKEELLKQVEEKDKFSPAILLKLMDEKGLKLGGVIDLTFTFKYYNIQDFLKNSVEHKKIFTKGHVVPSEDVFQEFAHAVKTFDTKSNDHIIGVHCTHGVNRTGYLICRYMIEEMGYEPEDAITLFGEARGHTLERDNYLEDLRHRKMGQSTYDPNFQASGSLEGQGYARNQKQRWRHQKEDHAGWRRNHNNSARDHMAGAHPPSRLCGADAQPRWGSGARGYTYDWQPHYNQSNNYVDPAGCDLVNHKWSSSWSSVEYQDVALPPETSFSDWARTRMSNHNSLGQDTHLRSRIDVPEHNGSYRKEANNGWRKHHDRPGPYKYTGANKYRDESGYR